MTPFRRGEMRLRSEWQEGANMQGLGRGNSKSKGHQVGTSLACSRSRKMVRVAGSWTVSKKVAGDKAEESD